VAQRRDGVDAGGRAPSVVEHRVPAPRPCHRDAHEPALAEAAYRQALGLEPASPDAHLALARLYQARGEQDAADWHAQRFIELEPDSPDGAALLAAMRLPGAR
jgi:tetratricopeptide (TPR) repeat protein